MGPDLASMDAIQEPRPGSGRLAERLDARPVQRGLRRRETRDGTRNGEHDT